jgi:excisionase family DNA binding protein
MLLIPQDLSREQAFATVLEAAQFLRLSKAMVHKQIHQSKIPCKRYGRAVRIPWSWLRSEAMSGEPCN